MWILWMIIIVMLLAVLVYGQRQLNFQHGQIEHLITTNRNLSAELGILQEKMQTTLIDPLTQLPGWQLFEDRLHQSLQESERYQFILAVLLVDIHDLDIMDKVLGETAGKEILVETAKRLRESVREVDSVARYSNDVFAVMLRRLNNPASVNLVAQRILQSLSEAVKIRDQTLVLSATIGASLYPADGKEASSLLRNAGHALQLAKQGHLACQFYHDNIPIDCQREFLLATGLRKEAIQNELVVIYEPILNAKKQTLFGFKTFLAWQHPVLGRITADELSRETGKLGMTNQFTFWLLEKVCQEKKSTAITCISVSIQQLQNTQFLFHLSRILQENQFNPANLLLEIGNTAQTISWDVVEKAVNRLKYLKVRLAVSDTGPWPFSMSQLKKLAADYLFIDNMVIDDAEVNTATQHFIKAMLTLIRSLSMEMIVINVESQHQMRVLLNLGCYIIQGDFVEQLLPVREIPEKI